MRTVLHISRILEYNEIREGKVRRSKKMLEAKLTSKGQITIPVEIRRLLNVKAGDHVSFQVNEQQVVMEGKKRPLTIQERFANYDFDQSNEELKEAMKEADTGENIGEENI